MHCSGCGYSLCLVIWVSQYALIRGKGCNSIDAEIWFHNFSDAHVGGANCVVLHNARVVAASPGAPGELRNDEYRLVGDPKG